MLLSALAEVRARAPRVPQVERVLSATLIAPAPPTASAAPLAQAAQASPPTPAAPRPPDPVAPGDVRTAPPGPTTTSESRMGIGDEFDAYVPRSRLETPPAPTTIVDVRSPEELKGVVDLRVEFTLFIDETGKVRRVRIETPGVHPAFERAIADSFEPVPFTPGRVDGEAVRSRIRLEVEFSNVRR